MTPKTTISARVSPDTRQTLDRLAAAGHTTTSELAGRVLGEWAAGQAAADEQVSHRAGQLVGQARDCVTTARWLHISQDNDGAITQALNGISRLVDAIDVLAGTAPEEG